MQKCCIKQLSGVLHSTKYESLLIALGLTTMSTRVNQSKLNFFNKIKLFDADFYVRRALTEQFRGTPIEHSFSSEIRGIFGEYSAEDSYQTWLAELETLEARIPQNFIKNRSKRVLHAVDFQRLHNRVANSALQSSGQARLVHTATLFMNCHLGVLQVLKNPLWTPSERTLFLQTFTGCDFVTPFNHKKKPACKFCPCKKADWPHLLLKCPNAISEGVPKVVTCVLAALDREDKNDLRIHNLVSTTDNPDDVYLLLMGIFKNQDFFSEHIKLKHSINKVTKITARSISSIECRWTEPLVIP